MVQSKMMHFWISCKLVINPFNLGVHFSASEFIWQKITFMQSLFANILET